MRFVASNPGEVIARLVEPKKISRIFVPEKYVKDFETTYGGSVKILPLEPLILAVLLAKYGLNPWLKRFSSSDEKEIVKRYFNTRKLVYNKDNILVKIGNRWYTVEPHDQISLKKEHIERLITLHEKDSPLVEIHKRSGEDTYVLTVDGFPVIVYRKGKKGITAIRRLDNAPEVVREVLEKYEPYLAENFLTNIDKEYHTFLVKLLRRMLRKG